jgi:hypothetical protein
VQKKKILLTFLVVLVCYFLVMLSGCGSDSDLMEEPVEPEEIVEAEAELEPEEVACELETEVMDESEVKLTFHPGLGKNNEYEINISNEIVEQIEDFRFNEGEILKYPVLRIKEAAYPERVEQLRKFTESIATQDIREEENFLGGNSYYKFKFGNHSYVLLDYYSNFCAMKFEEPISIPGIEINLDDKESLEKALEDIDAQFFSLGLKHRVASIVEREEGFYRINFTRLLDGVGVDVIDSTSVSLLVSQDGKIKEAKLWLAEFEKIDEVSLISGEEFVENVVKKEYPKAIMSELPYYDIAYSYRGTQFTGYCLDDFLRYEQDNGVVNLKEVELMYYFFDNNQLILPVFRLGGDGLISAKGAREGYDTQYEMITNAMALEYVKGYIKE